MGLILLERMRQLIYDDKFNEEERFPGETKFLIVENEDDAKIIGDNHSSPETLNYLGEEYIETLELIRCANFSIGIKSFIEKKYKVSFDKIINFLKDHRLIIYQGRNWMANFKSDFYILSFHGLKVIGKYDLLKMEQEE